MELLQHVEQLHIMSQEWWKPVFQLVIHNLDASLAADPCVALLQCFSDARCWVRWPRGKKHLVTESNIYFLWRIATSQRIVPNAGRAGHDELATQHVKMALLHLSIKKNCPFVFKHNVSYYVQQQMLSIVSWPKCLESFAAHLDICFHALWSNGPS